MVRRIRGGAATAGVGEQLTWSRANFFQQGTLPVLDPAVMRHPITTDPNQMSGSTHRFQPGGLG